MQEDTQAGMIYAFLEDYTGDRVCSKQLYAEALGNTNIPAEWETRAICEIMNTGIQSLNRSCSTVCVTPVPPTSSCSRMATSSRCRATPVMQLLLS